MNTRTEQAIEAIAKALFEHDWAGWDWALTTKSQRDVYWFKALAGLKAAKQEGMVFRVENIPMQCDIGKVCAYEEIDL